MVKNFLKLLIVFCVLLGISNGQRAGVRYLNPGISYFKEQTGQHTLTVYCYRGVPKSIFHIWQTVYMSINLQPEEYMLYHGLTPEEVHMMYKNHKSSWTPQMFSWRSKTITLDPFSTRCVGIETANSYEVHITIIRIDYWKVLFLIIGIFLFLAAPRLSSNPLFYYICGVTLGITTSVIIAFYLISKLIPKKPALYGFIIGGWTIGIYVLQVLWNNMKTIALKYQSEVLGYVFATGIISFIVCYRFGPVTDPRSKNLIKWALQSTALACIFQSSQYQELSVLCILGLLLYYNFPSSWIQMLLVIWRRQFPPKPVLLTEDEYHQQGARETVKALEELRKYCSSPECKQWKTVLSLRQPVRFAQFVEGKSHLEDSEILEYESESRKSSYLYTDDSDSYEDDQEL